MILLQAKVHKQISMKKLHHQETIFLGPGCIDTKSVIGLSERVTSI
jgi:hypothetical protein